MLACKYSAHHTHFTSHLHACPSWHGWWRGTSVSLRNCLKAWLLSGGGRSMAGMGSGQGHVPPFCCQVSSQDGGEGGGGGRGLLPISAFPSMRHGRGIPCLLSLSYFCSTSLLAPSCLFSPPPGTELREEGRTTHHTHCTAHILHFPLFFSIFFCPLPLVFSLPFFKGRGRRGKEGDGRKDMERNTPPACHHAFLPHLPPSHACPYYGTGTPPTCAWALHC